LFDAGSFIRIVAFAVVYAGIEYRYVNRYEREWTKTADGFVEKYVFWVISPYHLLFLLPLFIIVAFAIPVTTWAGNTFLLAVLEDVAYFGWRGKRVARGEWTTKLFGSLGVGRYVIPVWWPLDLAVAAALYLAPF
jgi:hypothetical protein